MPLPPVAVERGPRATKEPSNPGSRAVCWAWPGRRATGGSPMHRGKPIVLCAVLAAPAMGDELWRQNPIDSVGGHSSQDARNDGGLGSFSEVVDNFDPQSGRCV